MNAAIIGFYRMGATTEEMCGATGLHHLVIRKIISKYFNGKATSQP
jgi:hypothetical protein